MDDFQQLRTEHLVLTVPDPDRDIEAMFPIWTDPTSWEHAPEYRHLTAEQTATFLERSAARWADDGLGYWTARLRGTGEIVGAGGVQRHTTGSWNLLWRIDAAQRGKGLAAELGKTAMAAAHAVDGSVPVIAWIRANNPASQRVAAKLGLIEHDEQVDEWDGVIRIPYADRQL